MKRAGIGMPLLLAAAVLAGPPQAPPAAERFFPRSDLMRIGVYYYPEHWPEAQWARDFKTIAGLGFEFVHMAEFAWAFLEPREGEFDFAWLDRAVDLAARNGLPVILGTPSAAPPAWLASKHPEIFLTDAAGRRQEHGTRAVYSTSSGVVRGYVGKIVEALARHYGRDARVWGWQLDNEPSAPYDYGPAAQDRFRLWLQTRYGSIERLNEAWGTAFWSLRFDAFDQVRIPNEALAGEDRLSPHAVLDFKRFNADAMADFLNVQAVLLRRHIRPEQWVTTNYINRIVEADPRRSTAVDFPSYTMYPIRGGAGLGPDGFRMGSPEAIAFANDFFRPIAGVTGVMELQPGQVNWARINPQPQPGAVRMWLWQAFGGGCAFACTYRFRHILYGSEQYHDGIVGTDGVTLSSGGRQFARVIREMKTLRGLYDPKAAPPAEWKARRSAVLWNHENAWDLETQPQTVQWNTRAHMIRYLTALKSCGAPVDFVGEADDFSRYAVLVAPAYQLVDAGLVRAWTRYVEAGGRLVLTCRTGQKDRTGRMWEARFSEPVLPLIGAEIELYDMMLEDGAGRVRLGDRIEYAWNNWADVLLPEPGTEVLAAYANQFYAGKAAATTRRLGKGTVTYVGVDTDDGRLEREIVRGVFGRAGVPIADYPEGVYVEWRDGFWTAVNYAPESFDLPIPEAARIVIGSRRLDPAGVTVWLDK